MSEKCEHKNLLLTQWEEVYQAYDVDTSDWSDAQEPLDAFYITSGICDDCGKELTVQEIKDLTGFSVYTAEFTEI